VMNVFILKEGKEYNQGVAYLDDGTMVVVDNARKMISKTIDIVVTSVLQTTAGKMIFGRFIDPTLAAAQAASQGERGDEHQPPRRPRAVPQPQIPSGAAAAPAAANAGGAVAGSAGPAPVQGTGSGS